MKNKTPIKGITALILIFFSLQIQAQDALESKRLTKDYNFSKINTVKRKFKKEQKVRLKQLKRTAKKNNWKLRFTTKDGRINELQKVVNGKPIYYTTFNVNAAKSTRANHLNQGGSLGLNLMGSNLKAYVWDGGVANVSHREYDGAGGINRYSIGDNSRTINYHAEHVTGTIMCSGLNPEAKGMAPHAKVVGHDWNNDKFEAINAASSGMIISNHSYGYAIRNRLGQVQLPQHYFGGYIDESRDWDEIMFNAPNYLMVVAAGNDGRDDSANNNPIGGFGWDKLSGHATSKNNLVVANAQDAQIDANGNLINVIINTSSSEGPTDDLRIKPDITGNGTNVVSSFNFPSWDQATGDVRSDGNPTDDYHSITGTSMASPNVAGSLLLLQEHYKNLNSGNFMKAATLKGLALHTADDAGVNGPDAVFGWGLLNTKKAAELITNIGNESRVEELTLAQGESYSIVVESDNINSLLTSISWTDRPGQTSSAVNNTNPVLVNDLDVRVTKNGQEYRPYKLTGPTSSIKQDNNVDPYERVDINGANGSYTITVTHKGNLVGASQNFSLIISGVKSEENCVATTPNNVNLLNATSNTAQLEWNTVPSTSYEVRYRKANSFSWSSKQTSSATVTLNNLEASTSYSFKVRSICNNGSSSNYSNIVNFTTTEQVIEYCTSRGKNSSDEYIQKVELGSINNNSATTNGYSDFTDISTNLLTNSSNEITITPKWTGSTYNEGYAVFIDYNQDGDFNDAGETVFTKNPSKSTSIVGNFTVPNSANQGATRMRVVMKYNAAAVACGEYNYGETEDYTVVISNNNDSIAPSSPNYLVASQVTEVSAKLSWLAATDNVGVVAYNIYNGPSKVNQTSATSFNLTGLVAGTNYTYFVSAVDAAGNESEKTQVNFTTNAIVLDYCDSKGKDASFEWIDYVSYGGMTNSTSSDGGYGNYLDKVANVSRGETSKIYISAGFKSSSYNEHWAIFIDFNQNGIFDTSEKVASGNSSSSTNLNTDITIPNSAVLGTTRMRVSMKYNASQTSCEDFSYGEVEDYTVNISEEGNNFNTIMATNVNSKELTTSNEQNLSVYPNPAVNYIKVKIKTNNILTYSITNLSGNVLKSGTLLNRSINISDLNKGVYLLQVNDNQKVLVTKVIKK